MRAGHLQKHTAGVYRVPAIHARSILSNLPAYRTGVAPVLRGTEIGLAHGFWLVGPFIKVCYISISTGIATNLAAHQQQWHLKAAMTDEPQTVKHSWKGSM